MDPMKIVGFEGVFGTVLMVCVMMPIAYFLPGGEGTGLHEVGGWGVGLTGVTLAVAAASQQLANFNCTNDQRTANSSTPPTHTHTPRQNSIDTLVMIKNSGALQAVLLIDMFALLLYNMWVDPGYLCCW
jgi:hypothetical protein